MNVLAYDYPILGLFWTMVWVFLWVAWLMLLFRVIIDIFRSRDLGGFSKALWAIFVIVVPFLGVFAYLLARGHSMGDRQFEEARAHEAAFRGYVQEAASSNGNGGTADELSKLAGLRSQGVITEAEFEREKSKVLA